MAPKIYRLSSSGTWQQIKKLYRLSSSGTWQGLKKIWRLSSSGIWELIFSGLATPTIKSAYKPLLYFRDVDGYETSSSEIASATGSNQTSPAAYNGDKIFLIRGNWDEDPVSFYMRIQKSQSAGFTSGVSLVNASSSATRTYASYSDSNYADEVPLSSSNRYTITKPDVRDAYYFRGYIEATNDDNLMGSYSTEVVLPRMYVSAVNFTPNLDNTYGTSIQSNGGTFTWSYSGGSIVAADVYTQEFFVYPYNNTSGSPLYNTTISPGTSTSAAPTSTVTFTSASLSQNTQYTIIIRSTMNDGWKANGTEALRTIVSDQESFTTASAKPAKPIITSATDVGTNRPYNNGAVDLVWSQPSGGAAAVGYKIEYSEGPNYLTFVTLNANTGNTNTSGTFTGLKSNTNYKFYVTAIGADDNSDISDASSITLITTVPTAPTGVYAVAGNGGADVYYTATPSGSNGGKSIQYYRATSNPGSITATEVVSPILVEGLTNYTSYTFTVAAYNANGFSAESTASSAVTPQFPLPINNIAPTIASDSDSNYIYTVTYTGSWFNSPTSYDYQWQTSSDGGTTWTTRASGTDVVTIPDYNASSYKAQNIRIRVWGRNQTGASISPANSNTLFIFYTTPIINTFTVTGSELEASYSFSYSADDPSATVSLEYKLSSDSTWNSILFPSSPGSIYLKQGAYNFRLTIDNGVNGAYRTATSTTSATVLKFYTFSFGNTLYPSNNGFIGVATGSTTVGPPQTGRYIGVFPLDAIGNTSASTGYMLSWSDSDKYVIRFNGYQFGQFGSAAYKLDWMATFYNNQDYVDVKIITKGSSISGNVTAGLYKNGTVVAGLPGPYSLTTGKTYRLYFNGDTGIFDISYDEISITAPNDIMAFTGTKVGTGDDDVYFSITTAQNFYKSPVVTVNDITSNTATTITVPFTESDGCDYVTYILRSGSHSGSTITSGTALASPISISGVGLSAGTDYYLTVTPYNYKNQIGTAVQHTTITAPPAPTVTWSNVAANSATVSWSAASATSYYVNIYNTATGISVYGPSIISTLSVNLNGLTTAAQYTASVYGINADGSGALTAVSQYTDAKLFYDGNSNTGGSAPATTEHDYNSNATVAGNTGSLTRTYATWSGWSLFSNGSGTTYGPGYTTTILMDGSKYLYAKWTANVPGTPSVTVNYGPSTTTASSNYLTFNPVNFGSDTSSVLLEWGTSTSYGNSTSVSTNGGSYTTSSNLAWNTTYYWRARGYNPLYNGYGNAQTGQISIPITTWTVTFNAGINGGTVDGGSSTTRSANNGSSITNVPQATRSGYTFNGWYNSTSGGTQIIPAGTTTYTPTSNITLYAQFTLTQIAPFNGSVTVALQSGTAGRVGATYAVTSATASGTPTPSVSGYQWQYYNLATDTWVSISGATSSTYTISYGSTSYSDIGRTLRCRVTFSNGVSPNLDTGSNSITVSNATITGVTATLSLTAPFITYRVYGYNFQSIGSKNSYGTTTPPTTTDANYTISATSNSTIPITRQSSNGGDLFYYRLEVGAYGLLSGQGAFSGYITTNIVRNNATNRTNSPINIYGTGSA